MIAALPMYDWPEERAAVDAWYGRLRARVPVLPEALTRGRDPHRVWRDPGLVFGQTCWGPLLLGLADHLRVLAQPDYSDVPGGRGPFYRSALVARGRPADGGGVQPPAQPGAELPPLTAMLPRLAVNAQDSMSGWMALAQDAGDPRGWAGSIVETGAHRESLRAVAAGRADLAAIDCRSWALARAHEPCARGLVVVGWTAERPGLPYVTARTTVDQLARRLAAALIEMGAHAPLTGDDA
jgi:ABC-type phosphate/phosphonate transport system substrate-binding protein